MPALTGAAAASGPIPEEPLPVIDARQAKAPAAPDALASPAQRAAAERLRRQFPNLQLRWSPSLGTPRNLYTFDGFLTRAGERPGPQVVLDFLRARRDLYGLTDDDFRSFAVDRLSRSEGSPSIRRKVTPLTHFALGQKRQGREVFPARLAGSITERGELVSLAGEVVPNLASVVNADEPALSAQQALARAAESIGGIGAPFRPALHSLRSGPEGPERRQTFSRGRVFQEDMRVRLIYFAVARTSVRLVWEVVLGRRSDPFSYRVLVDARDGSILFRRTTTFLDRPLWRVHAKVLKEPVNHPGDVLPRDSPAPMTPGLPAPADTQAGVIPPALVRTAGDLSLSPEGWLRKDVLTTTGNNAIAYLDLNDSYHLDPGEQPEGTTVIVNGEPTRLFDFPPDLAAEPTAAANQAAAVTNAFFLVNWWHDRMMQLGFDEAAGNFQQKNFTAAPGGGDPVEVRLHGGDSDNASFTTNLDGTSPRLDAFFYRGPSPDRDSALDNELLIHELTHGLASRISGFGYTQQGLAMGEGYSDWYALALLSEPGEDPAAAHPFAAWSVFQLLRSSKDWGPFPFPFAFTENYYYGYRRFPYSTDLEKSPLTFEDMNNFQYDPDGVTPSPYHTEWNKYLASFGELPVPAHEVHNMGEIWGVTLWDARANLIGKHGWDGNELALQLVTDSLFPLSYDAHFLEARDALLMADLARTGGDNLCLLWEAFAKRGMGAMAQVTGIVDVVEDFEPQSADGCRPPLDLALVLDFSDSMNSAEACEQPPQEIKIRVLRDAVPAFLNAWEPFAVPGDRVGVMYFDDDAHPRSKPFFDELLTEKAEILADVEARQTGTFTALGPGVRLAAESFDNQARKRHMIVLSDGIQNVNPLIVDAGDPDGDGVAEHDLRDLPTIPDAWGGKSKKVLPSPVLLQEHGVPMHTLSVGSAPGTTFDELLAAIAQETGGLHQHTCVPQEELEEFLANSLVDALKGDTVELVAFETGALSATARAEHRFPINASAHRAAFVLSWSGEGALRLRVFAPDGSELPASPFQTGGASFRRAAIDFPLFLAGGRDAARFAGEWRIVAEPERPLAKPVVYRAYLLVDDAALEFDLSIGRAVLAAGEPIPLRVHVTEGGKALRPSTIEVSVTRPRTGLGSAIRDARLGERDRRRFLSGPGLRELHASALAQTYGAVFADAARRAALLGVEERVELFDDGRPEHGDAVAGDGIFNALYGRTEVPGEYQFRFRVGGTSGLHGTYVREKTASATVLVRDPSGTEWGLETLARGRFRVLVTPRDRFGNVLGPGHAARIALSLAGAQAAGPVEDRLDGTYAQIFTARDPRQVRSGTLRLFGAAVPVPKSALPGRP